MTLPQLTAAFLAAHHNRFRPHTRRAYATDLGLFARAFPDLSAEEVTVQHLRAFLQAHADKAPATLARRQAALQSCFAWAFRNDLVETDPAAKLDPVRVPARQERLWVAYERGVLSLGKLEERKAALAEEGRQLQQALRQIEQQLAHQQEQQRAQTSAWKLLEDFESHWTHRSLPQRKQLLSNLIEKVVVKGPEVQIHYRLS